MRCEHGHEVCEICSSPAERARIAISTRQPWETAVDLAARAKVHRHTVEKLLHSGHECTDCNKPTSSPPDPELETAAPDVKDWIATFAAWSPKKKKRAYAIFLHLTALGVILK